MHQTRLITFVAGALAALFAGCNSADQRLSELARHTVEEQAAQNGRIGDASKSIADSSKQLIEADARARQDLLAIQQDLRQDQAGLARQHDILQVERKSLHLERQRETAWGGLILAFALLLACLSPLVLAGMALWHLWQPTTSDEVSEVLTHQLVQILTEPLSPDGLPASAARPELPAPDRH